MDQKRDVACFPELSIDMLKSVLKSLEPDSCFKDVNNEELNPIVEWQSIDCLIDKEGKEKYGCPVANNRTAVCAWGEVVLAKSSEDAVKVHTGDIAVPRVQGAGEDQVGPDGE